MTAKQVRPCLVLLVLVSSSLVFSVSSTTLLKRWESMEAINEVNQKGPYIGLISASKSVKYALYATDAFKTDPSHPFLDLSGRRFRIGTVHGKRVIGIRSGVGLVNAAAATQQMLDLFDIKGVVHYGIAGNANNSMSIGDVVVPKQVANTGLWDWLNSNGTLGTSDKFHLDIGSYNVPKGEGINELGRIGYSTEQFFSDSNSINPQPLFWADISQELLHLATNLEGMELQQCLNTSVCLSQKPKLVVGLKGSTANFYVDNAAYREFLFKTFQVSSLDEESSAVVMTCLSNGFPVIVFRGLSDLAGAQSEENMSGVFKTLVIDNVVEAVIQFIKILPGQVSQL